MRLKILCVYYDEEVEYLAQSPEQEFAGHDVTVVGTYEEAKRLLSSRAGDFDIVLADVVIPFSKKFPDEMGPTLLLASYMSLCVQGFGVFAPEHFENAYTGLIIDRCVVVANVTCWTLTGKRDWNKLLVLVQNAIKEFVV